MTSKSRGFTLIELLVVIAIIGVLAAIILAFLLPAKYKARDAVRIADIKQLATMLDMYNIDKGHYPVSTTWATGCAHPGANWIPDGADYTWASKYSATVARDPLENCSDASPKTYSYWSDGVKYQITTQLEGTPQQDGGSNLFSFNGSSFQQLADGSPLTVTISSSASGPTNVAPIPIIVTFSRAVIDFFQSALSLTIGTITNFSKITDAIYSFIVTPPDSKDTLTVTLSADAAHDQNSVGNTAAQFSIAYDYLHPHPALSAPSTASGPFSVSVNFTVAVVNFSTGNISVQNGTASGLAPSAPLDGTTYTFTVTPTAYGTVTISIPADAVYSQAGNGNVATDIPTYVNYQ